MDGTNIHITPIAPTSTTMHSWTDRQVVTKVLSGENGQVQVKQDIYNTTIYDVNGNKQTVTNSHTIDYLV
tara:strand:- start:4546 stop:4755 length:210 start_codon:yes stop_codon:yes gene_type:complete